MSSIRKSKVTTIKELSTFVSISTFLTYKKKGYGIMSVTVLSHETLYERQSQAATSPLCFSLAIINNTNMIVRPCEVVVTLAILNIISLNNVW
jgi:hypothetical protein